MQRIKSQRLYMLTNQDSDRIKSLLLSTAEAILELIDYRCVQPIDFDGHRPGEAAAYRQIKQIVDECRKFDDTEF